MNEFLNTLLAMSGIELLATVFNVLYVILAARENAWCWLFGVLGAALSFVVYQQSKLYSDMLLQIFYAAISLYGWYCWVQKYRRTNQAPEPEDETLLDTPAPPVAEASEAQSNIMTLHTFQHLYLLITGLVFGGVVGWYFNQLTDAVYPYLDAMIASFSIITTFLTARKVLENWVYWMVIDTVCAVLYWSRGLYFFAVLFAIYFAISIYGDLLWRKSLKDDQANQLKV